MSIAYDSNTSTYLVQIAYTDASGKRRYRKKRGFRLKREAQRWEHEEKVRIAEGVAAEKQALPTYREVSEMYLADAGSSEPTNDQKRGAYRIHFADYLDRPINQITKVDMTSWRLSLAGTDLTTGSKNQNLSYVKAVFRFASAVYDIPNPAAHLRLFLKTQDEINSEMKVWTVDQFNTFLAAVDRPLYALLFEFLFWTGARKGEALALEKKDITDDGYCTIRQSLRKHKYGVRPTKNKKVRTIKLDSKLMEDLRPLMALPGPYVFGGEAILPTSTIYPLKNRACQRAGIEPIRVHDLRHSHVSILYDNGVSTKAIAERIGDTEKQVMETYKHLMGKQEDLMNSVIEELHT